MTCSTSSVNGTMPVAGAVRPMGVVGGQIGQGAAAAVLELLPTRAARRRWQVGVASGQGLQLGLLIGAEHVLVVTERLVYPAPGHSIGTGARPVLPAAHRPAP